TVDATAAHRHLRRSVGIEAAIITAAVAVTGVLVSQSPDADGGEDQHVVEFAEATLHLEIVEMGEMGRHVNIDLQDGSEPFEPVETPQLDMYLPDENIGP